MAACGEDAAFIAKITHAYAPGRVGGSALPVRGNQRSAARSARQSVALSTCQEQINQCLGGYLLVGDVIAQ